MEAARHRRGPFRSRPVVRRQAQASRLDQRRAARTRQRHLQGSMMNVVVCERPGVLTLGEREMPVRGPGEVLVRIRRVGMCGTDYHIFQGTQPYLSYPRIMGHELSGEIVEADAQSGFRPGQTVCIMPYLSCGKCRPCLRGKTNCCRYLEV